ncbi:Protein CSF1 [Lachancea thermotolerans]
MASQFKRVSLSTNEDFSWVFLVDWVLILSVSLLGAFYFGRVFGYTLTFLLEWLAWKRYKVKISIQSLKISFLGGRIFFKNLTVVTQNQTFSFLQGSITWRYWLLNSRKTAFAKASENIDKSVEKLPCRLRVECQGLEHFIYNKTQAFDNILNSLPREDLERFKDFFQDNSDKNTDECSVDEDSAGQRSHLETSTSSPSSKSKSLNDRSFQSPDSTPPFLKLLPLEYSVQKGAVVIGNKTSSSVMVLSYEKLDGVLDTCLPDSKIDLYKIKVRNEFRKFHISLKPNLSFESENPLKSFVKRSKLSKLWHRSYQLFFKTGSPSSKNPANSAKDGTRNPLKRWRGLGLYWKEEDAAWDDMFQFDLSKHEYARYTKVMKCDNMLLEYAFDAPGIVPHGALPTFQTVDGPDVGNSGPPPDYSIDIQISGASLYYGPWSHHEIMPLQKLFSPVVSRDSQPVEQLTPGSKRIYTRLRLSILIVGESVWRIPTREASKDLEFLKRFRETEDETRPFGWLEVSLSEGSEVRFNIAMCPTATGFDNTLDLHFVKPEIRTSVNHDILLSAQTHSMHATMGYPLGWNKKAEWVFDSVSNQCQIFILKDHITLLGDIISDFGSGEPTPYELFRPFSYTFNWNFTGYSIYLNVNDANIVNNPVNFNENCYLSFHGDDLRLNFEVPQENIAGNSTKINYELFTPLFRLNMNTPSWNTLHEFMKDKEVGRSANFSLSGSYLFHSKLDVDNIDTIIIECCSKSTTLKCYGYVLRYFLGVKMNYFGDFVHFKTTEEYMEELRGTNAVTKTTHDSETEIQEASKQMDEDSSQREQHIKDPLTAKKTSLKRMVNEKDVWFTFVVEDGCFILPENLYDCDSCYALEFDSLDIDLRHINYYMDLQAALSPLRIRRLIDCGCEEVFEQKGRALCGELVAGRLSRLHIHAHRMFGLPPAEETYFCKWDFSLGTLDLSSDLPFTLGFINAWKKLGFGFRDYENIMNYKVAPILDMTSVTLAIDAIVFCTDKIKDETAIQLNAQDISAKFADLENSLYSSRVDLDVANLTASIIDKNKSNKAIASFMTSIKISNFCQLQDLLAHSQQQKVHIASNDAPFHRCPFLIPLTLQNSSDYKGLFGCIPPGVSIPSLAVPLQTENVKAVFQGYLKAENATKDFVDRWFPVNEVKNKNSSSLKDFKGQLQPILDDNTSLSSSFSDPTFEHNTLVVNLENSRLSISPECYEVIGNAVEQCHKKLIEQFIDNIELDVVLHFIKMASRQKNYKNIRVLMPTLDVLFETYNKENTYDVEGQVKVTANQVSLDWSLKKGLKLPGSDNDPEDTTSLLKIESLDLEVFNKLDKRTNFAEMDENIAFGCSVKELEAWSYLNGIADSSLYLKSINASVALDKFNWLIDFMRKAFNDSKQLMNRLSYCTGQFRKAEQEFFYRISKASDEYQITHDPPVITKPAYITRLPSQHVRESRSWKIVTRLRHILNYLPTTLISDIFNDLKNSEYPPRSTAEETFLEIFSNWGNWDYSDVEKCYMYRRVFTNTLDDTVTHESSTKIETGTFMLNFFDSINTGSDSVILKNLKAQRTLEACKDEAAEKRSNMSNAEDDLEERLSCIINKAQISLSDGTLIKLLSVRELFTFEAEHAAVKENEKLPAFQQYTALVDRCDIQLLCGANRANLKSFGNTLTIVRENKPEDADAFSTAFAWSWFEFGIRHRNTILLDAFSRSSVVGAHGFSGKNSRRKLDLRAKKFRLKLPSESKHYCTFIDSLEESWNNLRLALGPNTGFLEKPHSAATEKVAPQFALNIDISDLTTDISLLSPLAITKNFKKLTLAYEQSASSALKLAFETLDIDVFSTRTTQQYLKISQSNISFSLHHPKKNNASPPTVKLDSNITKLKLYDPRDIALPLGKDIAQAKACLASLKSCFGKLNTKNDKDIMSQGNTKFNFSASWIFQVRLNYVGLLIPLGSTSYITELNEVSAFITADEFTNKASENSQGALRGDLSAASIAFLINDRMLPEALSRVVDFAVSIKIAKESEEVIRSLQIESPYFRIALSPFSLVRILFLVNELSRLSELQKRQTVGKLPEPVEVRETFRFRRAFRSVQVLSYNFCLGWIFDVNDSPEPGLIWGYQRLFAAHEKPYGKLTLLDAYFSIAEGSTSDDFYAHKNSFENPNRSFLPSMQIRYWIESKGLTDELFIRINGERLDVRFMSKSIDVAGGLMKSLNMFDELKKQYVDPFKSVANPKRPSATSTFSKFPGLSTIQRVDCKVQYAGGVFRLYSLDDVQNEAGPSFQLESPSVEILFDYRRMVHGKHSHILRAWMIVYSSHNTIFPTCVPVLNEMARDIRQLLKGFNRSPQEASHKSVSQESLDYRSFLRGIDISFLIDIGKQQISFSCEPKAKVQADLGFEKLAVKVFTNDLDMSEPLSLSIDIYEITAKSRHIFSREVSTSIKIDQLSWIFILTHPDTIHTYGIMHIPNIDVYFNIKQLQDLNIFVNIWKPDSYVFTQPELDSEHSRALTSEEKPLVAKFKKVSSTTSFPWNFILIISKIKGDIDLGISLGVLSLTTDRIWAITDHYSDWTQKLSLQMEKILLSSDGRLGGTLLLRNFSWMSRIRWPVREGVFESPLVTLDVLLDEFDLKLSFDYHLILIASVEVLKLKLFNKRDPRGISRNLLSVAISSNSTQLFLTALAPANILDVYNTILRMRKDNRKSYFETLGDSNTKDTRSASTSKDILNSLSFLRTELEVSLKFVHIQIYPSKLFDMEVLTFKAKDFLTQSQIEGDEKLKTHLKWQIHGVKIALSRFKNQLHEKAASQIGVKEYIEHARKADGGTILVIPAILIGMTTWHDVATNTVELLYSNSFGGKIGIRWNLGSINFLREMWATHARAMALRRSHNGQPRGFFEDEHLEEKLRDVDLGDEYEYVPLEEPHIEIPQTKDLGEATPPVEWFGVNRKQFPGLTHQAMIVPLQKLAHIAETEWARILGRA